MMRACYLLPCLALLAASGCAAMCDGSMDCRYNAYGGIRDRIERERGRVSSQFDPAESLTADVEPLEVLEPLPDVDPNADDTPRTPGNLTEELLDALGDDELPEVDTGDPDST